MSADQSTLTVKGCTFTPGLSQQLAEARAEIERLRVALAEIAQLPEAPSLQAGGYGDGYNAARGTAADLALTALDG